MRSRTRSLLLLALWASSLCAQIEHLATTDDGSTVYFSTVLRPRGTAAGFMPKILVYSQREGRSAVFAEREVSGTFLSSFYRLSRPDVSGDGSVVAYTGERTCLEYRCGGTWNNGGIERFQGDVVLSSGASRHARSGIASLSRNGRYAVFHAKGEEYSPFAYRGLVTRVDLMTGTGTSTATNVNPSAPRLLGRPTVVSSGGVVVTREGAGLPGGWWQLQFFDGTSARRFKVARDPFRLAIDDTARIVVYDTREGAGSEIVIFDPAAGTENSLVHAAEGAWQPSLSSNGRVVLFLSRANFSGRNDRSRVQAFVMRTDGTGLTQITRPEDDVTTAVLAGNGTVAYAATASNQLLRIDLADGAVTEVIPVTPALSDQSFEVVRGSLMWLNGTALTRTDAFGDSTPLPTVLDGVRVLVNGTALPLVSVTPSRILGQVPWETPLGSGVLTVETASQSSLEGTAASVRVFEELARFLPGPPYRDPATGQDYPGGILAAHEHFDALISLSSPGRPGEMIHAYMTGLGPVEPTVPSGVVAPATPLSLATRFPKTCRAISPPEDLPVEVVFAGLAPGLVGLYQVDLRLPAGQSPQPIVWLVCATPATQASGWLPVR